MVGEESYIIESNVSEVDIAKVRLANPADITFDAYSDDMVITGKVIEIDPAETLIQEVVYYRVKIGFENEDFNLKPGMSADITIYTAEKENILFVPQRAIIEEDDKKYLRMLKNSNIEKREISTGLLGDDGFMEIINNIDEGEQVVTYIRDNGKK